MNRNPGVANPQEIDVDLDLKVLHDGDIVAIDRALEEIGPFGEVHLVVEDNRLRFIRIVRSEAVVSTLKPKSKGK